MSGSTGLMTGNFNSTNGKDHLVYGYILPQDGPVRGIVQISHGMAEHFGRYTDFARYLAGEGIAVYGHDHLGHGLSADTDRDLGYFGETGPDVLAEDLHEMTRIIKSAHPGVPLFLFGHSMGSLVARAYIARYGQQIDGVVLSGSPYKNPAASLGIFLAQTLAKLKGKRHRSPMLERLAFGSYNKRIKNVISPHDWLSRDRDMVARYDQDPLCGFNFTLWGYRDLFTLLRQVSAKSWTEGIRTDLPVLLLSGDGDPVGGYGKVLPFLEHALLDHGLTDVTVQCYPGGRHEMLNETNRAQVYADILHWLKERLPTPQNAPVEETP